MGAAEREVVRLLVPASSRTAEQVAPEHLSSQRFSRPQSDTRLTSPSASAGQPVQPERIRKEREGPEFLAVIRRYPTPFRVPASEVLAVPEVRAAFTEARRRRSAASPRLLRVGRSLQPRLALESRFDELSLPTPATTMESLMDRPLVRVREVLRYEFRLRHDAETGE